MHPLQKKRLKKERNIPIDIAKGISIILVAFGHSLLRKRFPEVHSTLALVRMPLFFFLSGVFFTNVLSPVKFILKKTDSLLKPYFGTLLIVLIFTLFNSELQTKTGAYSVLYGTGQTLWGYWVPMWFLTHLWTVFIAAFLITKYTSFNSLSSQSKYVLLVTLLIIGSSVLRYFFVVDWDTVKNESVITGWPFSIDLLPVSIAYFLMGNTLREQILAFRPKWQMVVMCIFIYSGIYYFTPARLEMNYRFYFDPLLTNIASAVGIYFVLSLSFYLTMNDRIAKVLSKIGFASLFILIFHPMIHGEVYSFLKTYIWKKPKHLWAWVAYLSGISFPLLIRAIAVRVRVVGLMYLPYHSSK